MASLPPGCRARLTAWRAPQIPHLVELGVTAVEILPVFEYDELEFQAPPHPPFPLARQFTDG